MMDYRILKRLVIEAFQAKPNMPIRDVMPDVERLAAERNLFPKHEKKMSGKIGYDYYNEKRFTLVDRETVAQIIWQMVRENLMVIGEERNN